ncbi:MAG: AMP-binding protein [Alphaproteobacteria bacterium]
MALRRDAAPSPERVARHSAAGHWPRPGPTEALASAARLAPAHVAFVEGDRRLSIGALVREVETLAAGLRGLGIGRGDVVSWQLPNWIEGIALHFAIDRVGGVSNPLLPILREREVAFIARQAGSRALFVPGSHRGFDHRELALAVTRGCPDLEHVVVVRGEPASGQRAFDSLRGHGVDGVGPTPPGPHDVSALFYTSGTTADPKGVLHTHSTLGHFLAVQQEALGDGAAVGILWFPLTHVGGVCAFGTAPVAQRTRAVLLEPFDPERALDLVEAEGVTSAGGPTPILQALLAARGFAPGRVASVRVAGIGATDVPPELVREVARGLGAHVYRSYGMTECPMATAGRRGDPPDALCGTDGRPAPGVALRIVDESGRPVGPGEEGEIELHGPQLCVGYADPALDRDAFLPDGFLRTGDLGVRDQAGFVRITGRRKDVILRKGENLSAKAIEDEIHEHPAVAEAAVVGVPDPACGERVCACIVPRPGVPAPDLASLGSFMRARGVMVQKIPEQVEILAELPRNATGKVKKHELRARLADAPLGRRA